MVGLFHLDAARVKARISFIGMGETKTTNTKSHTHFDVNKVLFLQFQSEGRTSPPIYVGKAASHLPNRTELYTLGVE